jgi:hypothetical protein
MSKQILMYGALLAIVVIAMVGILFILDVVTIKEATTALGRTLSVILVSVTALVLSLTVVRIAKKN